MNNPSFFPRYARFGEHEVSKGGMTLRDHIAISVLQAVMSSDCGMQYLKMTADEMKITPDHAAAAMTYAMADAMLAKRGEDSDK